MEHKQEKTQAALCGVAVIVTVALILAIIGPGYWMLLPAEYKFFNWVIVTFLGYP